MIDDGLALYRALEPLDLLAEKPPMWWPAYGTFEVVVGAVLTQNSQWVRVEQSLENLRAVRMLSPEALARVDVQTLCERIRPSGLFKNKSRVLQRFSAALLEAFGDFETFKEDVSREWLLAQKGVGPETADSMLCYACERDVMVVDAYTARLLAALGYAFETYDDLQAWCTAGMAETFDTGELSSVYARFHGMIVEYVKRHKQGKTVAVDLLAS